MQMANTIPASASETSASSFKVDDFASMFIVSRYWIGPMIQAMAMKASPIRPAR